MITDSLAIWLGLEEFGLWVGATVSVTVALVLAVLVFLVMGIIRNRAKEGSQLRRLMEVLRLPLVYLVLFNSLLENFTLLVPTELQGWVAGVDTLQVLLVIGTLLWIVLRYIARIERTWNKRAERYGSITLPLVGDKISRSALQLLFKSIRAFIGIIGLLMALQAFGVSLSGLLAFGGVGGIVVGFAARDVISNMFSGLRIFWSRPFDVGDWIRCESQNVEGVVQDIGWQVTEIRTFDKRPLYVPNSLLATTVIENPQRMTNRRIYQYFGLRYADVDCYPQVLDGVREMLASHDEIAQDQIIMVNLDRFNDFSIDFFVYCMTKTTDWIHYHKVKEDVLLKIAGIVKENGADFAFPTRTVHLEQEGPPISLDKKVAEATGA